MTQESVAVASGRSGCVSKRKDGTWIDFRYRGANGEWVRFRKRVPKGTSDEEAAKIGMAYKEAASSGIVVRSEPRWYETPFRDVALAYLERVARPSHNAKRFREKKAIVELHLIPFFGKTGMPRVNDESAKKYASFRVGEQEASAWTVNGELCVLSAIIKFSNENGTGGGYIKSAKLPRPTPLRAGNAPTREELKDAIEALVTRDPSTEEEAAEIEEEARARKKSISDANEARRAARAALASETLDLVSPFCAQHQARTERGVYILIMAGVPVYVGSSLNLDYRIGTQKEEPDKKGKFDEIRKIVFPDDAPEGAIRCAETCLISILRPEINDKGTARDMVIVRGVDAPERGSVLRPEDALRVVLRTLAAAREGS